MYTVLSHSPLKDEHEALVIGVFEDEKKPVDFVKELDDLLDGHITELIYEEQISGKKNKLSKLFPFGKVKAKRLYFIGLGKKKDFSYEKAREAFATGVKQLNKDKTKQASFVLSTFSAVRLEEEQFAHSLAEAVSLACYKFDDYKEKTNEVEKKLETINVYSSEEKDEIEAGLHAGQAYGEGTNLARTLVNTPGNLMTPTDLAAQAEEIAKRYGMEYEVLEREDMEKLGMGALLAVAQGTDQPPKMIVLKYRGQEKWENVLSFVGKGLTFDAGGISIKPAANMHEMKMDMGGSAAVLGAMEVIGRLKPNVNVLAVIPSSENLLNGSALKPGDVITSMAGKTIEVRNTDAEGRLILADGITYAKQLGANYIVDIATLTGAVLVALGTCTTGAVTNNEEFMEDVLLSANEVGELMWRLPNFEPYKELLKTSDVADLNNSPGRNAGSITAGLFLGEFAGDTPWVHLDIAGTAWSDSETALSPKGASGVMVRTLATLARHFEK
ncbi:leucyl aminopeptidase [Anaerobacillus sp. MEB173]|uniref:leucyl aminopeptidase n=1 Tax=Anaerobacillus sp. MEB173 TaxID=3383345 RepID=UPI003F91B5D1